LRRIGAVLLLSLMMFSCQSHKPKQMEYHGALYNLCGYDGRQIRQVRMYGAPHPIPPTDPRYVQMGRWWEYDDDHWVTQVWYGPIVPIEQDCPGANVQNVLTILGRSGTVTLE
jgi:hypothetical protein